MTAASCVDDLSRYHSLYIRIGIHNLTEKIVPEKKVKVNRILIDGRYKESKDPKRIGDMAFLELERSLEFDNFIQPGLRILH